MLLRGEKKQPSNHCIKYPEKLKDSQIVVVSVQVYITLYYIILIAIL